MSNSQHPSGLPSDQRPDQLEEIDVICDAFEEAWRRGPRPSLNDYLERIDEVHRPDLFRVLLDLEIDLRREEGDSFRRDEYAAWIARYPSQAAEVFHALSQLDDGEPVEVTAPLRQPTVSEERNSGIPAGGTQSKSARIGRFQIVEPIAEGGFGTVFRGWDEQLEREVAIKVARTGRPAGVADLQLLEARVAASLDHPAIVPVYEVGRLPNDRLFIVSKLIRGTDLKSRMAEFPYPHREAAQLIATVAEALHSAHRRGVIHRDVKPANILIDEEHRPYITDFGLALRERDTGSGATFVGTPAYMSPEQAREEGHLVDARSDVFSLSVVLFEVLTGERPFRAPNRMALLERIRSTSAPPPSEFDPSIPPELDRITLKGLARQAGDRYPTAELLADDLRAWLAGGTGGAVVPAGPAPMVPKGLRAFDESDASFFLRLVPGPRTREGIPESIAFWKIAIESREFDRSFRVGALFGPSGTGKSSLVRAGILPLLAPSVICCRTSATPDSTAERCLQELRRRFPVLSQVRDLVSAVRELRSAQGMPRDQKLLLVFDQFEQWLSVAETFESSPIALALRQCDGVHVQAILLVRDEYWSALMRLMKFLDIDLNSGNCRMTDTFDPDHAEEVLLEFARAYGRINERGPADSGEVRAFAAQVTRDLVRGGRAIPVQLAMFAEAFKSHAWTRAELRSRGGVSGVVHAFLDGAMAGPEANPRLRLQTDAVVKVLRALLPPSGAVIKERPKSADELAQAAGLPNPIIARDILQTLDHDLRIVSTVRPDADGAEQGYQLAHDSLIPMIRDWVLRKQRATFRGRAENLLQDRAEGWHRDPARRNLPSPIEWLSFWSLTRRSAWNLPQQRMMQAANRWYGRVALAMATFVLFGFALIRVVSQGSAADAFVRRLVDANTQEVPAILQSPKAAPRYVTPRLVAKLRELESTDPDVPRDARWYRRCLHVRLALLDDDPQQIDQIIPVLGIAQDGDRQGVVPPSEIAPIIEVLRPWRTSIQPQARRGLDNSHEASRDDIVRTASILAQLDSNETIAPGQAQAIAEALAGASSVDFVDWTRLLEPIRGKLLPPLFRMFDKSLPLEQQRNLAAVVARYAAEDTPRLVQAIARAQPAQLEALIRPLRSHQVRAVHDLRQALESVRQRKLPGTTTKYAPVMSEITAMIEQAQGVISERAAIVQTLPEDQAQRLMEDLVASGFRPTSLRPFRWRDKIVIAAAWCRDGQQGIAQWGFDAQQLKATANTRSAEGMDLIDISAYEPPGAPAGQPLFAATWKQASAPVPAMRLLVEKSPLEHARQTTRLRHRQFAEDRLLVWPDAAGQARTTSIWHKWSVEPTVYTPPFDAFAKDFHNNFLGFPVADCQIAPIDLHHCDTYKAHRFCSRVEFRPGMPSADKYKLAFYKLQLQYREDALRLSQQIFEDNPKNAKYADLYVRSLCEMDRGDEARAIAASFDAEGNTNPDVAVIRFRLTLADGDQDELRDHFTELDKNVRDATAVAEPSSAWRIAAARCYSLAAADSRDRQPENASRLRRRGIELLADSPVEVMASLVQDRDFDGLRAAPEFRHRLEDLGLGLRYIGLWCDAKEFETELRFNLDPSDHVAHAKSLLQDRYTPATVAVRHLPNSDRLIVASVWQRPLEPSAGRVARAAEIANLAIALGCLGQTQELCDLLSDENERQAKSYMIERLPASSLPAPALAEILDATASQALRRNLLLALGTFPRSDVPSATLKRLSRMIQSEVVLNPLAQNRAAGQWCLRQWSVPPNPPAAPTLASSEQGTRNWRMNSLGQTMVVVHPPKTLIMGSPNYEQGRKADEAQHERNFQGPFEISATEVTVAQFRRFLEDPQIVAYYRRSGGFGGGSTQLLADGPQTSVRYFDAVRFCQWLSRTEGLPADQWCFPGIEDLPDGEYEAPPNFLDRSGYRLPTEAEWEFACRAVAATPRHYGESSDLLGAYAWTIKNSSEQHHAVGSLKPNELGLFDMLGSASEWCQDAYRLFYHPENSEATRTFSLRVNRVARGASYMSPESEQRSARRIQCPPDYKTTLIGFRVARSVVTDSP